MSIDVMSYIWKHSPSKGSELLLLLALADYANHDGTAHPSVKHLAEKCRMTERNVQLLFKSLVDSRQVSIKPGQGPHGCHLFRLHLPKEITQRGMGEKISPPTSDVDDEVNQRVGAERGEKISGAKSPGEKISSEKISGEKISPPTSDLDDEVNQRVVHDDGSNSRGEKISGEKISGVKSSALLQPQISPLPSLDPDPEKILREESPLTTFEGLGATLAASVPPPVVDTPEGALHAPTTPKKVIHPLPPEDWLWALLQEYADRFEVDVLNDDDWWTDVGNSLPVFTRDFVSLAFADLAAWLRENPLRRPRDRNGWLRRMRYSLNWYFNHKYSRRPPNGKYTP